MILFSCTPFFTAILALVFLGERITIYEILAMFGSLIGIAYIASAKPGTQEGEKLSDNIDSLDFLGVGDSSETLYLIGVCSTLVSALLMSFVFVLTRALKEVDYGVI
jgi:drug/metabolite transporter (DMT)-like permease